MRIETPFSELYHRQSLEKHLKESLKPGFDRTKKVVFLGVLFLVVGAFIMLEGGDSGYYSGIVLIAIGLHYLIQCINYYSQVQKSKQLYRQAIDKDVERLSKSDQPIVFEFMDDAFYFEEEGYNARINWSMFSGYRLIDDYLFLDFDRGASTAYVLSKNHIGKMQFDEVLSIVSVKLPQKGSSNSSGKKRSAPDLLDSED